MMIERPGRTALSERHVGRLVVVSRSAGVANRADPTAWTAWRVRVGRFAELELLEVWGVVVRLKVGRRVWFASECVRPVLWQAFAWLFDVLEDRAFESLGGEECTLRF